MCIFGCTSVYNTCCVYCFTARLQELNNVYHLPVLSSWPHKFTLFRSCHIYFIFLFNLFAEHLVLRGAQFGNICFTCFGRQASILRGHYTSSFWCELCAVVVVGWLQVVVLFSQPATCQQLQ